MIVSEARTLAIREMLPILAEGDQQGVRFESGTVKVPESFHRVFKLIKEGEWNNLSVPEEMGGQGAPAFLGAAAAEYFSGSQLAAVLLCEHGQRYGPFDQSVRH